jgi:mRNA interferase RelE/StbE
MAGAEREYRVRVGDYRVIYSVDDAARIVAVEKVGHRGDVYRRR